MSHRDIDEIQGALARDGGWAEIVGTTAYQVGTDILLGEEMDKKAMAQMGVNVLAELANKGITYGFEKKAVEDAARDADAKAQAAITADRAATNACSALMVQEQVASALAAKAVQLKNAAGTDKRKQAAAVVKEKEAAAAQKPVEAARAQAQMATQAQDAAGAGLPPEAAAKRAQAAQEDARKAAAAWGADPKNQALEARAKCAQQTAAKAASGSVGMSAGMPVLPGQEGEPSFLKAVKWGLPVWGWGAIGGGVAAVATTLALVLRKKRS